MGGRENVFSVYIVQLLVAQFCNIYFWDTVTRNEQGIPSELVLSLHTKAILFAVTFLTIPNMECAFSPLLYTDLDILMELSTTTLYYSCRRLQHVFKLRNFFVPILYLSWTSFAMLLPLIQFRELFRICFAFHHPDKFGISYKHGHNTGYPNSRLLMKN